MIELTSIKSFRFLTIISSTTIIVSYDINVTSMHESERVTESQMLLDTLFDNRVAIRR